MKNNEQSSNESGYRKEIESNMNYNNGRDNCIQLNRDHSTEQIDKN